eukprot:8018578-Lingulodinium_polyedra.AAC.1
MQRAIRDEHPMPALPPLPQVGVAVGEVQVNPPRALVASTDAGAPPPPPPAPVAPGPDPADASNGDGPWRFGANLGP